MLEREEADVVFESHHDLERWEARARSGDIEIVRFLYRPPEEESGGEDGLGRGTAGERFIVLAIERDGVTRPMSTRLGLRPGDWASVALHAPERGEAVEALVGLGWVPEP